MALDRHDGDQVAYAAKIKIDRGRFAELLISVSVKGEDAVTVERNPHPVLSRFIRPA